MTMEGLLSAAIADFFFSAHFLDTCKQADKEDGTVTWAADIVQE